MKTIFYLSVLLTITTGFLLRPHSLVQAQSATGSAEEQSIQDNIKDRVEKILKANPDVQGTSVITKQEFGIVGTLEKIVSSTVQVKTYTGEIRIIELDKQAVLLKDNKQITKEELELNAYVIVMGTMNDDQSHVGRRLITTTTSLAPAKRQTILGTYQKSTTRLFTVIRNVDFGQESFSAPFTSRTKFLNILGTVIKRTDFKEFDKTLIVIPESTQASPSATRIYQLTTRPLGQ